MKSGSKNVNGRSAVLKKDSTQRRIEIFDTTLRDGTQSEHIAYSLADKIQIAHELDDLGVDYIEGGWPGSNPKDMSFFDQARKEKFQHARITAFGSTRHA